MKRLWIYYLYLLVIWGSFRYFVRLPDVIEELWFKPMIWVVPLVWWNIASTRKVWLFNSRWVETSILGLGAAIFYWLSLRRLSTVIPMIDLDIIGVAVATAMTEEAVFSGFIMGSLHKSVRDLPFSAVLTGLMVAIMRVPIILFVYKLSFVAGLGVFLIAGASGMVNAWIRGKSGNVLGSIIARVGLNLALLG